MAENEENTAVESGMMNSKFWRTLLVILSVFLIFAGPTYVIYGLSIILNVNLVASFATGFVLFAVGLVLMRFLVQKKIVV